MAKLECTACDEAGCCTCAEVEQGLGQLTPNEIQFISRGATTLADLIDDLTAYDPVQIRHPLNVKY